MPRIELWMTVFAGLAGVVIAAMYTAMVLGMAELSSALPTAGGGYTFARRALGPWGGFATGTAVLILGNEDNSFFLEGLLYAPKRGDGGTHSNLKTADRVGGNSSAFA